MITTTDYFMGRDKTYPREVTKEIRENAVETVHRINELIGYLTLHSIAIHDHPIHKSPVSSGWRSMRINGETPNASPTSRHMTGQACDFYDPIGDIDQWALDHPDVLERIGLWQEHPASTRRWAHFQTVPPRSGRRVFYP